MSALVDATPAGPAALPTAHGLQLPLTTRVLANGLTVVVSECHDSNVAGLCVLYKIGSRLEPRNRTGFAHLFEHLMFEGTPVAAKGVFDRVCEGSGGSNNGQTRPDATLYMEAFPSSALDRFLWLEADRMRTLAFSQETLDNQRDVVKEEIRVNVQNDPYGLFEYSTLPAKLFEKWENAHDGYGDFKDLDAANLSDVKAFFTTYYRPNNAIVVVTGDVSAGEVLRRVDELFGGLPAAEVPAPPDLTEAKRTDPALLLEEAPLAQTPALGIGWRTPERTHRDAWALFVAGELLHDGRASRLYRGLVEGRELAAEVSGGFNVFQGSLWYEGVTLMLTKIAYKRGVEHDAVLAAVHDELSRIVTDGVPAPELERVKTKILANYYASLESPLNLAVELAQATAFDGEPSGILTFPASVERVTSDDIVRATREWLSAQASAVVVKTPPSKERAA